MTLYFSSFWSYRLCGLRPAPWLAFWALFVCVATVAGLCPSDALAQTATDDSGARSQSIVASNDSLSALDREQAWPQDCRASDQIWLVSSRDLPHDCGADSDGKLRFYRFQSGCEWLDSEEHTFHQSGSASDLTLFFVHGNQISSDEARRRGLSVYRALVAHAQESTRVRFVVFSWPADRIRGQLRDARLKAERSSAASVYLGRFLNRIDPQTNLSMTGFSFGARVITGALHIAGGGTLDGRKLKDSQATERKPTKAVLMSAALDCHWLEPKAYHGHALSQVDHVLLINNPCDPAMRWYHLLDRCTRPCALGYSGVASVEALGDNAEKIEETDVRNVIGRSHDLAVYLCQRRLMASAWDFLKHSTDAEKTGPEITGYEKSYEKNSPERSSTVEVAAQ